MRAPALWLLLLLALVLALALLPLRAQGLHLITELAPLPERTLVLRGAPPAEAEGGAGASEMEVLGAALDADQERLAEALTSSREPPLDRRRARRRCYTVLPEPEDAVMADRAGGHARNHQRTTVATAKTSGQNVDKEDNGDDVKNAASTRNPRDTISDGAIQQRRLQMLLSMKEDLRRERVRTPESIRASNGLVRRSINAHGRQGLSRMRRASPFNLSLLPKGLLPAVKMAVERRTNKCASSTDSDDDPDSKLQLKTTREEQSPMCPNISGRNRCHGSTSNDDLKSVRSDVFTPRAAFVADQQGEEGDEKNSNDNEAASERTTATTKFTTSYQQSAENQKLRTLVKTSSAPRKFQTRKRNIPSEHSFFQRHTTMPNTQRKVRGKNGDSSSLLGNAHYHQIAHVDDVIAGLMALQAQRVSGNSADHHAPRHGFLHRHHLVGNQREPSEARELSSVLRKMKSDGRTSTSQLTKLTSHRPSNKIENSHVDSIQPRGKKQDEVPRSRMEIIPSVRHQAAYEAKDFSEDRTSLLHENRDSNGEGVMLRIRDFQLHQPADDGLKNKEAASPEGHNEAICLAFKDEPYQGEPEKDITENIRQEFEAEDNSKAILILPSALIHKHSIANNYHTSTTQEALSNKKSFNIYPLGSRQEFSADDDRITSSQSLLSAQEKRDEEEPASLMAASSNCQPGKVDKEKRKGSPEIGIEGEGSLTILSFKFHNVGSQKSRNKDKNCLKENAPSLATSKEKMSGVVMPEALLFLHPVIKDNVEENAVLSSTTKSNTGAKFKSNVHHDKNELTGEELQKDISENSSLNKDRGILQDWEKNSRRVTEVQGIKEKNEAHREYDFGENGIKRLVFPAGFSVGHQHGDQGGKERDNDFLSLVTAKTTKNGQADSSLEETSHLFSPGGMEKQIGVNVKNNVVKPLVLLMTHNKPSDIAPAQINIKERQGRGFKESLSTTDDAELTENMGFNANEHPRNLYEKAHEQISLENEDKKINLGNGKYNKQFRNNQNEYEEDSMKLVDDKGDNTASNPATNKFPGKGTMENNEKTLRKIAKVNNFKADEQSIIMYNRNLMPCAVEKRGDFESSKEDNDEKSLFPQSTQFVQKNDNYEDMKDDPVTIGGNVRKVNEMATLSSNSNGYSRSQNQPVPDGSHIHSNDVISTSLKEKAWTIVGVPNIIQQLTSTETSPSTRETKRSGIMEKNGFGISNEINLKNSDSLPESKMSVSEFIQPAKAAPQKLIADFSNEETHKLDNNFDQEYSVENEKVIQSFKSLHQSDTTQVSATQNNPQEKLKHSQPISGENQDQQTEIYRQSSTSSPSSINGQYFPESSTRKINSGEYQNHSKDKKHNMKALGRKGHLEGNRRKEGNHGASCQVSIYLDDPNPVPDEMSVRTASDKPSQLFTATAYETEDSQKPCACKVHVARENHGVKAKDDLRMQRRSQFEMEVTNSDREMEPAEHDVPTSPRCFKFETQARETAWAEGKSLEGRAAVLKRQEPSGNLIWIKEDSDRKGSSQRNSKPPPSGPCALLSLPESVQRLLDAEADRAQHPQPQDENEDMEDAGANSPTNLSRKPAALRSQPQPLTKGNGMSQRTPDGEDG